MTFDFNAAPFLAQYAVGIESKLPWTDELHQLTSRTTGENAGADFESSVESYQSKPYF